MIENNWKSQSVLAKEIGVSVQVVHNWIRRNNNRLEVRKDENIGKLLVRLKNNKVTGKGFCDIQNK